MLELLPSTPLERNNMAAAAAVVADKTTQDVCGLMRIAYLNGPIPNMSTAAHKCIYFCLIFLPNL